MQIKFIFISVISFLFAQENISVSLQVLDLLNSPVPNTIVKLSLSEEIIDQDTSDSDGWISLFIPAVGVSNDAILPLSMSLAQNYPNPWNPTTTIQFSTLTTGRFSIHNILGQEVASYTINEPGYYNVTWGGLNNYNLPVSAGVYIYTITTENTRLTKKMVLLDGGNSSRLNVSHKGQSLSRRAKTLSTYEILFSGSHIAEESIQIDINNDTTFANNVDIKPYFFADIPDDSMNYNDTLVLALYDYAYNDDNTNYMIDGIYCVWGNANHEIIFRGCPSGEFDLTIYISDIFGDWQDSTSFRLDVIPANHAPIITLEAMIDTIPEQYYSPGDSLFLAMYSIFDSDVGDSHIISLVNGSPENMLIELNGNRIQLAHTNPDFNGSFVYGLIVTDAEGLADSAFAELMVTPVNDAPVFAGWVADFSGFQNTPLEMDLHTHMSDPDGDILSYSLLELDTISGEWGTLEHATQEDNNGIITLTPEIDWYGVMQNIRLTATDGELADTSFNSFSITIDPTIINQIYNFVAVYDDTLLDGGISTLKFRKMNETGTEYEWDADSILTSTNGIINLSTEPGVYSIRGFHSEEHNLSIPMSVFYDQEQRIGQSSHMKLDGVAFVDTVNAMTLDGAIDTVTVYKMMQGFPWSGFGNLKSYLDQNNQGLRGFPDEVIENLPFIGNLNYVPPSQDQQLWTQELIDTLTALPQINFNGYYYETTDIPTEDCFRLAFDESFQYAGNIAHINWNTNEITSASAMYQPDVTKQDFKGEIMEGIMDVDDLGGNSPDFITTSGEISLFGKQAIVIEYLLKNGTLLD